MTCCRECEGRGERSLAERVFFLCKSCGGTGHDENRRRLEETLRQSDRDWQSAMEHYRQNAAMLDERSRRGEHWRLLDEKMDLAERDYALMEMEAAMTEGGTPSADVIQFTIDMAHLVGVLRHLGLKLDGHKAVQATLAVRETEARMRGMAMQGNAIVGLMHSHSQPPE